MADVETEFYLAPDGEDAAGRGTRERPWRTLAYAARQVAADRPACLHLAAGLYAETTATHLPPGVSVVGAGRARTTLSAGLADAFLIQLRSPHNTDGNQTLRGFSIDGQGKTLRGGVWVENRNHVTLRDVAFLRCNDGGSVFTADHGRAEHTEPRAYVTGARIHDCVYEDCSRVFTHRDAQGVEIVDQMKGNCAIGGLDGAEIWNLDIHDATGGYGIKFADCGFYKNTRIRDCRIRVNPTAPRWVACCALELWNVGPGCEVSGIDANTWLSFVNNSTGFAAAEHTQNLKLHDCRVVGVAPTSGQEAVEIGLPGVEVYDNVFERVGIGCALWSHGQNIDIHHNVFRNPAVTPMPWGENAAVFFVLQESPHDTACSYRRVRVRDNTIERYEYGIFVRGMGGAAKLEDLDVADNRCAGIAKAICEVEGPAANVSGVRVRGNRRDNEAAWIQRRGEGAVDVTLTDNVQEAALVEAP